MAGQECRGRQPTEAITLYSSILAAAPQHVVALNNLAELLARSGKATEALTLTRQAVGLQPQHPLVRDTAGWVAFQAGHIEEALLHLGEAVRLAPKQGISHYHLAKAFFAQHHQDDAGPALKLALECGLQGADKQDAEQLLATLSLPSAR